jgi:hypothetical protein
LRGPSTRVTLLSQREPHSGRERFVDVPSALVVAVGGIGALATLGMVVVFARRAPDTPRR